MRVSGDDVLGGGGGPWGVCQGGGFPFILYSMESRQPMVNFLMLIIQQNTFFSYGKKNYFYGERWNQTPTLTVKSAALASFYCNSRNSYIVFVILATTAQPLFTVKTQYFVVFSYSGLFLDRYYKEY